MPFEFVNSITGHLAVHAADARLSPPQAYLLVQDLLIFCTALFWAMCYIFYMVDVFRSRPYVWSAQIFLFSGNLAYEIFFAISVPKTTFERLTFPSWAILDIALITMAIVYGTPLGRQSQRAINTVVLTCIFLSIFWIFTTIYPDDGHQMTAYWAGLLLEMPFGYLDAYVLWWQRDTQGHSIEVWLTRNVGDIFAYSVFAWRYLNVPANWGYVASRWSIGIIVMTFVPEVVFPFIYCWVIARRSKALGMEFTGRDTRRLDLKDD